MTLAQRHSRLKFPHTTVQVDVASNAAARKWAYRNGVLWDDERSRTDREEPRNMGSLRFTITGKAEGGQVEAVNAPVR